MNKDGDWDVIYEPIKEEGERQEREIKASLSWLCLKCKNQN